ncbi:hypothetical protein BG006_010684 [Podila minutissima]|uniref:RING-type E3 ubiquitin transferase n=1 Tax=Podila minutissima TaxID=64525 RepID=A0A9P5VIL1_9FUNG|nr:hypothetical protein BG006_010684 [Podila minutissima]
MPPQPCRFFRLGSCRNGDQCRFYHEGFSEFMNTDMHAASNFEEDVCTDDEEEDEEEDDVLGYSYGNTTRRTSAPITRNTINRDNRQADVDIPRTESTSRYSKPCRWYMAGYCLRGDECWFSHDLSSSHSPDGASIFFQDEATSSSSSAPRHEDDRKCAICLELPTTFGLLVSCNHAFCLTCIRTWRSKDIPSSNLDDEDRTNSVTKACPNCRTPSLYVVPSSFFPANQAQKDQIFSAYKQAAGKRPCKYFKLSGTRRWCPFGDDCFFAHLDDNGQTCKVNPLSDPRLRRRRTQMDAIRNNVFLQDLVEFFDGLGLNGAHHRHQHHHQMPANYRFVYDLDEDYEDYLDLDDEWVDEDEDRYDVDLDSDGIGYWDYDDDEYDEDTEEEDYDEHGLLPSYHALGLQT